MCENTIKSYNLQDQKRMNNKTLDYYNQNAKEFVAGTVSVDFNEIQDRFIEKLSGKNVLDFGCGVGGGYG